MSSYCGYIALVGRPNVGKSTLLNRIVEQKLSITSRKPQTTRHNILGVRTEGEYQYICVDTPGLHERAPKAMNRLMNKSASMAARDVDVVVLVVEAGRWDAKDDYALLRAAGAGVPCILAVNKIDKLADKALLLPFLEMAGQKHTFDAIIPLSARSGVQVDVLLERLKTYLPEGPHLFEEDAVTDRPVRFLCAELLREKVFRYCGQELPYSTTVEIESFTDDGRLAHLHALILVEKESHKRMIIGDKGRKLREIATSARMDMEKLLDRKVFLECWCKVKSNWSDDERALKQLGYGPES